MIVALVGVLVFAGGGSAVAVASSSNAAASSSAACDAEDNSTGMDHPDTITLFAEAVCYGAVKHTSGSLFATMGSSPALMGNFSGDDIGGLRKDVDPCSLPGGSDLPGAKVTLKLVLNEPAPTRDWTFHYTLPDDSAAPLLRGGSNPPHGTTVQPGDTIKIHITASEPTHAGPQEGIEDIQLIGPDGLIDSADYGKHPIACDRSRLSKTLTTTYTVPADPPAVIHLRAIAHDYAGNESIPLTADFPTAPNAWTGTMSLTTTRVYNEAEEGGPYTCSDAWTGPLTLKVATNRSITGSLALTENGTVNCDFPFTPEPQTTSVSVPVTGTASPSAFTLIFGPATDAPGGPQSNDAGLVALVSTDACSATAGGTGPPVTVPLVSPTSAAGTPQIQYTMGSDCGGSAGDTQSVSTNITLKRAG